MPKATVTLCLRGRPLQPEPNRPSSIYEEPMKYICLVYNEPEKLAAVTDDELTAHVAKIVDWVGELEGSGRHVYSAGLQSVRSATTVRIRNGSLAVTDGPFAETKEVFGGFTIFEARDLNEAIQVAAKMDAARLGSIEVRPVMDVDADLADPLDRRIAKAIRKNMANKE